MSTSIEFALALANMNAAVTAARSGGYSFMYRRLCEVIM